MKIYISGKISGLDPEEAKYNFNAAKDRLVQMGYKPVSPYGKGSYRWTWEENMRVALKSLLECDGIYMLDNWRHSRGAIIELDLAIALDMEIIYQENERVTW